MISGRSSNRSKIFIVSPTESELTSRGKRHPNLARYLSGRGHRVECVSSDFNHAEKRQFLNDEYVAAVTRIPYKLTLFNVGRYESNLSFQRVLWHQRFAYRCYQYLAGQMGEGDVLIIPSRPPELIYAAKLLKRKHGCRIILDIRDIWPDALSGPSSYIKKGFSIYCDYFLRRSVDSFDAYINVAPSFLKWLHRYAPDAQSSFIPLGFDEARWGDQSSVTISSEYDPLKLVYCGTLTDQFNILPILEVLASGKMQFHLTLIGDNGSGERYSSIMEYIRVHFLESKVTVLGLLTPDQLVVELPKHDITVVPMVSGALPNKVFDSIAAGLPMLSLGNGDSTEFVQQFDLGWTAGFDSTSVESVMKSISSASIALKCENILRLRPAYSHGRLFEKYEAAIFPQ